MKEKIKSYEFWVSIVSAVMVVLQSLSLKFNLPFIQETVMGFLGILAVAGIIKKKDRTVEEDEKQDSADSVLTKDDSSEVDTPAQKEIDKVETKIDETKIDETIIDE